MALIACSLLSAARTARRASARRRGSRGIVQLVARLHRVDHVLLRAVAAQRRRRRSSAALFIARNADSGYSTMPTSALAQLVDA